MKMMMRTGPAVAGLGLFFGLLSGCGGSEGSDGGSGGTSGSEESTSSQAEDSSSSGNSEAGSDGEASTTGEGSGGSETDGEGSSTDGESSSTDGEGSGGASDGEASSSTDGNGEGGTTDAGESSSTDGEGGTTGEGCPEARPEVEAACEGNERRCSYEGDCGTRTMVCREGQWRNAESDSDVATPTCDSVAEAGLPEDGDSCACMGELRCEFDACEERGHVTAVCNEGTWTVEASACEVPRCGPGEGDSALFCEAGQVCVATQQGEEVSFACEENPCESETSCGCASELCGDSQCQIREEGLVVACVAEGEGG